MSAGGRFIFDLLEGTHTYFEDDDETFVHGYQKVEVEDIVGRTGLRVIGFDEVEHAPNRVRLLVIAGR
jgi:hypothetical protein